MKTKVSYFCLARNPNASNINLNYTIQHRATQFSRVSGFTLVELMVAITLGLLITAAAIQLFTGGLVTSRLQQANAEIQDSGIFGVEYVARDVRLANFGNVSKPVLNDRTLWGGIIFTANSTLNITSNAGSATPAVLPDVNFLSNAGSASGYLASGLLSHSVGTGETVSTTTNEWRGLSNVSGQNSDQLTIQFIAPSAMTNCEGRNVLTGDLVVQRYFIRADANGTVNNDYALACDANIPNGPASVPPSANDAPYTIATSQPYIIKGLGDAGQIVIPRVDHFHVLLGTRNDAGNLAYYTINQYKALRTAATSATATAPAVSGTVPPRIVSVQVAVLIRSVNNAKDGLIDPTRTFSMLDQTVTPTDTTSRFVRRVYISTIAIRNGLGDTQ